MANKNKAKTKTEVAKKVEPTKLIEKAMSEVEEVKAKAQREYDEAFASLVIVRN